MSLYNAAVWTQSIVCTKYYLHRPVTVQLTVDIAEWQIIALGLSDVLS